MPVIPLLLALSQFAPSLVRFLNAGESAQAIANTVSNIAQIATGEIEADKQVAALTKDPEAAMRFQELVIQNDTKLQELYLTDTQNARERDVKIRESGKFNYRADCMAALSFFVVAAITWAIWKTTGLGEFEKATITLILGRFLGYLDTVFQFEFGSTKDSKMKTETINNLAGRNQ